MLKQRGPTPGEAAPRKKLSFREPEVESPTRNGGAGPISAPPLYSPTRGVHHRHHIGRPHSVAGVVGLGGFSALGGVPGIPNSGSNQGTTSPIPGVTTMLSNPALITPGGFASGVSNVPASPILTPPNSPIRTSSGNTYSPPTPRTVTSKSGKAQQDQPKPVRPTSLIQSDNKSKANSLPKSDRSKNVNRATGKASQLKQDNDIIMNGRPRTYSASAVDNSSHSVSLENIDLEVCN